MLKLLCPLLLIFLTSSLLFSQNINFQKLGIRDGLSHPTVYAIYQDELGTMWFGTRQGLNRYDGNTIESMPLTTIADQIQDNTIWKVGGNREGSLYILVDKKLVELNTQSGETKILYPNNVIDFQNIDNNIWILTNQDIIRIDTRTQEQTTINTELPSEGRRTTLLRQSNGDIWVGTTMQLIRIPANGGQPAIEMKEQHITALFESKGRQLWIGTKNKGAFTITQAGICMATKHPINSEIRCINEDANGNLLFGTFDGFYIYNPKSGDVLHHTHYDRDPLSISHSSIYSLFKDRQETIWIGTYFGGVNYYNHQGYGFKFYSPGEFSGHSDNISIIGNMIEDNQNNIWICTEGRGLYCTNKTTGQTTHYQHEESSNTISHNNLKCIHFDPKTNKLYIGTHTGGLSVLNLSTRRFTYFSTKQPKDRLLPNDVVNKITCYNRMLFLVTQDGVATIDMDAEKVIPNFASRLLGNHITSQAENIFIDSKDRMWISLFAPGIAMFDFKQNTLKEYYPRHNEPGTCPRHRVIQIFEDSQNQIYFTTEGSGIVLFNEEKEEFTSIEPEGLVPDHCFRMAELPNQKFIVTSTKGFSIINRTKQTRQNYSIKDKLPISGLIEENGLFMDSQGEIYLAGINGLINFREENLQLPSTDYNLYFSKLLVNNEVVLPHQSNEILKETITHTNKLKLKHNQSNISITFATSNYINLLNRIFEYRLEGLDDQWIQTNSNTINYNNLKPGKYKLSVREQSNNPATAKQIALELTIQPPFYASTPAYLLYTLIILGILTVIVIYLRSKAIYKASLEIERKEKEQNELLNQAKLKFFTNISHEFRTPLTLILNHAELIQSSNAKGATIHQHINKIRKNANLLKNLINELLDFRKQENGKLKIRFQHLNLVEFTKEVFSSFKEYAHIKNIRYTLDYPEENIMVWFDPDQIQKVLFNLISNAFKHTQQEKSIRIDINLKNISVTITVTDTGDGISADELNKIFDPYYQAENINTSNRTNQLGTGIGLALSKGIVEMHGGTIAAESRPGEGSAFKVELRLGDRHIENGQKAETTSDNAVNLMATITPPNNHEGNIAGEEQPNGQKPTILIVEDNEDLLELLSDIFKPLYQVITATNGEEGLMAAREKQPDIILSDDMMPKMKGSEMCQKIKANLELSHIPLILLTIQDDQQKIAQALLGGADDYITKPFDAATLVIRCNNMVETRKRLKEKYSNQATQSTVTMAGNILEKEFIDKTNGYILKNMDNPQFNVDILSEQLNMSRSKFYAKIKDVTGMTPNTYILNIKMNSALHLLQTEPNHTISEIAYKLGFSSARYFSLCFKDHYGYPPSEVRNRMQNPE